jgi:hypothetical protein
MVEGDAADRWQRFGRWSEIEPACVSGRGPDQRPFFAGHDAYSRMDLVRTAINEIRVGWERRAQYMSELRGLLDVSAAEDLDAQAMARVQRLFATRRSWDDSASSLQDDYGVLRLYTSKVGYDMIFRAINAGYRSAGLTSDPGLLRGATFLVELLSIDLFHFRASNALADEYTGIVYRGMSLAAADMTRFLEAARGPVGERYIAVPLAMVSASLDPHVAMRFALEDAARDATRQLLLWEIQVVALDPALMDVYRRSFPHSVVTSLCAVPIASVSDYPGEQEVLLRGPHFQILDVTECDAAEFGRPVRRLRVLMHNTNRDHITARASNAGADKAERDLFRALVLCDRFRACSRLAAGAGLEADARDYGRMAQEQLISTCSSDRP